MRRAAIYARVSTIDRGQDPETQLRQLREYAERRGFSLAHEYVDHASGAKNDRAEYRAMFEAARKRGFDVLLVWRYDRFARLTRALVNALGEFKARGGVHQLPGERGHDHAAGRAGVRHDGQPGPVRERADRRARRPGWPGPRRRARGPAGRPSRRRP